MKRVLRLSVGILWVLLAPLAAGESLDAANDGFASSLTKQHEIFQSMPVALQEFVDRYNHSDPIGLRRFVHEYGSEDDRGASDSALASFMRRWLRAHQIVGQVDLVRAGYVEDDSYEVWGRGRVTRVWMGVRARLDDAGGLEALQVVSTDRPEKLPAPTRLDGPEVAPYVVRYFLGLYEAGFFSGAYRLSRDGELVVQGAHGLADRNTNAPITLDTRFDIASISKVFVSLTALRLIEEGMLSLDDTVGQFLEGFPDVIANDVTVRHLLTHRSGIKLDQFDEYHDDTFFRTESLDQFLQRQRDWFEAHPESADGVPLDSFLYTNEGMDLLAAIIEKVTSQSFHDVVEQLVITPLGLEGTRPFFAESDLDVARGYTRLSIPDGDYYPGSMFSNRFFQYDFPRPSGGYSSTVRDLQLLGDAIVNGDFLNEKSRELMMTSTSLRRESPHFTLGYGMGFDLYEWADGLIVGHGGGRPGASSRLDVFDSGYTLTILSNHEWVAHTTAEHLQEVLPLGAE